MKAVQNPPLQSWWGNDTWCEQKDGGENKYQTGKGNNILYLDFCLWISISTIQIRHFIPLASIIWIISLVIPFFQPLPSPVHSEIHTLSNCFKLCSGYFPAQNTSLVSSETWCSRSSVTELYSLEHFYLHFFSWNSCSELSSYHCSPICSAFSKFKFLIFSFSFHCWFSCLKQSQCPKTSIIPNTLKRTFIFWNWQVIRLLISRI